MKNDCRIAEMLRKQKRHISFHTPGHKRYGGDITELSYSDNLLSPNGVIGEAEKDIARILGAEQSFILTDGSTCGVYAMLRAVKAAGARSVACSAFSHKSVKEGCRLLGLTVVEIPVARQDAIPLQPSEKDIGISLEKADVLLLTSPDYYGNFPPLSYARRLCKEAGKPLLVDGAHGAHLHFGEMYAGLYADLWVDGVHKSLPALTQGAVVSAKNAQWAVLLKESVCIFRTTSPSYPIMASVEYAVKYPRNAAVERMAQDVKRKLGAYPNADWSKILIAFGNFADAAQDYLERKGVYPEFNDGNYLMFYLSPCTKRGELKKLVRLLEKLPRGVVAEEKADFTARGLCREEVELSDSVGRTCAKECGLFPPCLPLLREGERVTKEKAERLSRAKNTFGLIDGKILVFREKP